MSITITPPDTLYGTWSVDTTHSSIRFAVRHMVVSTFRGEVADFEAELVAAEDAISLTGRGRARSIHTSDETLTAHLFAPDFFDADLYPEITLSSRAIAIDGADVTVEAEVTIKGVTQSVTLLGTIAGPVEDPFGGVRLGLELAGTIDRRAFGLDWNLSLPGGGLALGHDVGVSAELEFVRSA